MAPSKMASITPWNHASLNHSTLFETGSKAGCPGTVTPFNGTHDAGVQVLNTSNFSNRNGPLRDIQ